MRTKLRWIPSVRMAIVAMTLLCITTIAMPAMAARHDARPQELDRFMWGLAGQESGWSYYAHNASSGAFGKYQIMPANWKSWARHYLDRGWHDQSPLNQELVARSKLSALYGWLGDWGRVAYWWLSGSDNPDRSQWSEMGKRYVRNVLSLMDRAPKKVMNLPADPSETTGTPINAGDWRVATRRAKIRNVIGSTARVVGWTRPGEVFVVRKAEWPSHGKVLRIRVQAADGTRGWINARKTLPAKAPAGG